MTEINKWGTIYDYLNWWGNLSFEQVPFNYVDSLILSELAYVSCDDFIKDGMTIESLSICCTSLVKEKKEQFSLIYESTYLLSLLKDYKRFKNIHVFNYCNSLDYSAEKQFSAMTFILPHHRIYIAFRGTDDTILGWKEDFNMIYKTTVPSQISAVNYLCHTVGKYRKKVLFIKYPSIYLGGHSKGGNLAIYAGVNSTKSIKKHIKEIHNFDGPGFNSLFINADSYQQIKHKITTFRPVGSIIGGFLYHDCKQIIVDTVTNTIMQHSGFYWKIKEDSFCTCQQFDPHSIKLNQEVNELIESMSDKQKEFFVQEFFELLDQSHIKTVSDLTENKLTKLITGMKGIKNMSSENRNLSLNLLKEMLLLERNHIFKN